MQYTILDQNFLRRLDLVKNKSIYAKIILLNWNEEPIEEIQGKITSGSINIDANSAIRRTCSLSMVSEKVDITNSYWALKNKFKLEVGVENNIDDHYPSIIWFKQGIYVFTSLNMNVATNNFTISLNGKDKGCLLNGEVSGTISASTDFGKLEEYTTLENGEIIRNVIDIPIIDIIKNAVHVYGGEPLHNIVLNDIDNYGMELLEYRGDANMYLPRHIASDTISNFIINTKQEYYLKDGTSVYVDNEENKKANRQQITYYDRTEISNIIATKVWAKKSEIKDLQKAYNLIKIEFGDTAGYRRTELTYPGDLVANVGESLVSILDKIKNMFGDFEYFYDIDGRFIFQKKKTYVNTSFNNIQKSDGVTYVEDAAYTSSITYSFENGTLLSAFSNPPQILNIKNDFSIWGNRTGASGAAIPIHMRYAIDNKPVYYAPIRFKYKPVSLNKDTYESNKYYYKSEALDKYILAKETEWKNDRVYYNETDEQITSINQLKPFTTDDYDWREIIYQMALDYFKYNHKKSNFTQLVANVNKQYYPNGITGYENYYTDMQGFWRQLYHAGVIENPSRHDYELFSLSELTTAAKESILDERTFIENEDIAQMFIDYIYDNFDAVRDEAINSVDYLAEISNRLTIGYSENSLIIQNLMQAQYQKEQAGKISSNSQNQGISLQAKEAMEEYTKEQNTTEAKYIQQLINKLKEGFAEDSYTIQKLLYSRWRKLEGNDTVDYDNLKKGLEQSSAEYKAYTVLENYRTLLNGTDNDIAQKIKNILYQQEINPNQDNDLIIEQLLTARWYKLNARDTTDYNSLISSVEINSVEYKLYNKLQEFQTQQVQLYEDIAQTIQEYLKQGFSENHAVIQDLLKMRWDKMGKEDCYNYQEIMEQYLQEPEASIYDTEYQLYSLLNKYKIQRYAEQTDKYDQIDFIATIMEEIELAKRESRPVNQYYIDELLEAQQVKFAEHNSDFYAHEILKEYQTAGDASTRYEALCMVYEYAKTTEAAYNTKSTSDDSTGPQKFFSVNGNKVTIEDAYLSRLYASRSKKLNTYGTDKGIVSNERFVWIILEVINNLLITKDSFKEEVQKKLNQQIELGQYDFLQELIDYIATYYDKKDYFFYKVDTDDLIYIEDDNISYLLNMRQEKLDELPDGTQGDNGKPAIMENNTVIQIIYDALNRPENNTGELFKADVAKELSNTPSQEALNYTQEILEAIEQKFDNMTDSLRSDPPIEKTEDGIYIVHNNTISTKLSERFNTIKKLSNFQSYLSNDEIIKILYRGFEQSEWKDKEVFLSTVKDLLRKAAKSKKNFVYYSIPNIYVTPQSTAFSEVTEKEIFERLESEDGKEKVLNWLKQNYNDDGWNVNVSTAPETLNFWFDFLDTSGELGKYSVQNIGDRPKAVNNDKIKGIYFQEVPKVLFITPTEYEALLEDPSAYADMSGYTFIQLQSFMEGYFSISGQGQSAKDELDSLLYQHTYATENVTLTTMPIYHLQPNTRIFVKDDYIAANGEYIISKITLPLSYNGTSSITATKAVERIY